MKLNPEAVRRTSGCCGEDMHVKLNRNIHVDEAQLQLGEARLDEAQLQLDEAQLQLAEHSSNGFPVEPRRHGSRSGAPPPV
ncbi:hypothetical protein EYF80_041791 [Liparis tanakae]|uniref:Uncharacterized protein n=1 Tax=Liparis tanakae TaxID=230148 RepID=A0A4Z2G3C7_9TELE|nr:hypothetical protein EYF80_041791 [Liparis tanakae]